MRYIPIGSYVALEKGSRIGIVVEPSELFPGKLVISGEHTHDS